MHWVTNLLSILNWIQLEAIELQMSEKEASWYPNDATWQHVCRVWCSASQSRNTLLSIYAQYLKDGITLPTPSTWKQKPFHEPWSPMYLFNDEVLDSSASTSYLGPTSRYTGERNGNPLQYSCLENLMDRGAWGPAVQWVVNSQIWLKWLSMHHLLEITVSWPFEKCPLMPVLGFLGKSSFQAL